MLQDAHRRLESVYFIEHGMAVILARTKQDGQVGVAVIGCAGMVGVPVALGIMQSPHPCVMEVPGEALQIGADVFRQMMDENPPLRQQLMNYVHVLLVQESQTVLCNARHRLMERLTRSLLHAHDRLADDIIPFTHDLLSRMLGVRRASITTALDQLESIGAVRKTRGSLEVINRNFLEQTTCECYQIITKEHRRLIAFHSRHHPVSGSQSASAS
jgi:CRP-like cAMP-binding protein